MGEDGAGRPRGRTAQGDGREDGAGRLGGRTARAGWGRGRRRAVGVGALAWRVDDVAPAQMEVVMTEQVRWGVLGAARIARNAVIPAIRRAGAGEVVAVSSASGRAEAFATEASIARHYASHDELLADDEVDAVYIALPNSEHARWTIAAAQAGKHVLCEKPIVQGVAELDEVEEACRAAGVQLAEARSEERRVGKECGERRGTE